ncbi:MAG: hypothetical protein KF805_04960 [Phycisphaeraceae bacterium]|nr:hypothetical protein [Phycisphaeraceae bacterium]
MMPVVTLGSELEMAIPIVGIVFGCFVWVSSIVVSGIKEAKATKQREESRREIAAYIAEGSMSPEQGERLMQAGEKPAGKKT